MEHFWSTSGAPLKGLFPLGFEVLEFTDLEVFRRIRIDVQGGRYISMSQSILNDFDVYPRFAHSGSKGVAEAVTTEVRKQELIRLALQHDFIVAVTDDAAEGLV